MALIVRRRAAPVLRLGVGRVPASARFDPVIPVRDPAGDHETQLRALDQGLDRVPARDRAGGASSTKCWHFFGRNSEWIEVPSPRHARSHSRRTCSTRRPMAYSPALTRVRTTHGRVEPGGRRDRAARRGVACDVSRPISCQRRKNGSKSLRRL